MSVDDAFEVQLDDGLQTTIASLNFGFLGLVNDLSGLSLGLKIMALLTQDNNLALNQSIDSLTNFSKILDDISPHLKLLKTAAPTTATEKNAKVPAGDATTDGYIEPPSLDLAGIQTSITGAIRQIFTLPIEEIQVNRWLSDVHFSGAQVKQADADSDSLRQKIPGTSDTGNLTAIYNFRLAFKNPIEAIQLADSVLKSGIVTNSTSSETEDGIDTSADLAAQLDALSTKIFNAKTQTVNQAYAAVLNHGLADFVLSNSKINETQFLKMAKDSGSTVIDQMTSPALFASIAPVIAALNGQQVAPGLAALGKAFDPANLSKAGTAALGKIGVKPGGALYESNPAAWLEDVLIPALKRHGYSTQAQQDAYLQSALKGSSYLPALQGVLAQLDKIEEYKEKYDNVAGNPQDSFGYISTHNPVLLLNQITDSVEDVFETLGKAATPQAISVLKNLADVLNATAKLAVNHPDLSKETVGLLATITAINVTSASLTALGNLPKIGSYVGALAKMSVKMLPEIAGLTGTLVTAGDGFLAALGPVGWVTLGLVAAGIAAYHYRRDLEKLPDLIEKAGDDLLNFFDSFSSTRTHSQQSPAQLRFNNYHVAPYSPSDLEPQPVYLVGSNHVTVENMDDIYSGSLRAITRQASIQTGPTGFNTALTLPLPSGSMF